MKPALKYTASTIFWLMAIVGSASASDDTPINSGSSNAVFVLKTRKEMVGGSVMVFNGNKDLVTVSRMKRRKLEIDFSNADFGIYTVRITKGSESKEFHFMKK